MGMSLHGRVVVITGGARGIGLATARALIERGATVAIGDIDADALTPARREIGAHVGHVLDVTDPTSFDAFLQQVEAELGPCDVLINNAGIMPVGPVIDEDEDLARRIMTINVLGVITGTKLALRRMLPRGRGHIVNMASLAGELPFPGLATYCASKHAVLGFTDSVRKEVRGSGVHLSSVLPTLTNTQLASGTRNVAGLRHAEPTEIAQAIAELLRRPRSRVRITRSAGLLVQAQRVFPRWIYESVSRVLGVENQFLGDLDTRARRSYEERARATTHPGDNSTCDS